MIAVMRIVGVMSGTSYDGIELAAAEFRLVGEVLELAPLGELSVAYAPELRRRIAEALPPGELGAQGCCVLDTLLGQAYGEAAARAVRELAGGRVDLVVSHGQTVFHWVERGRVRGTLQLGAPAWIAEAARVPVLADLRTADVAAGGQGAPLVPMFDALLLEAADAPRAALNLGGIANLTVISPGRPPIGYDVGPANALIDAAAQRFYGVPFDQDGRHAAGGRVVPGLLAELLAEPYYAAPAPKSTGKELFHAGYLDAALRRCGLSDPDDVIATVTELTARTVAAACAEHGVTEVIAAGGGVRNPVLMGRLRELIPTVRTSDELGVPPQAKEAYAFALLGWLSWHGLPGALPSVTGAARAAVLGAWTPGPAGLRLPPPLVTPPRRLRITTGAGSGIGGQDVGGRGPDRLTGHEL
jgi:anhydro-N-acetylmuramic acid kinase